MKKNESVFQNNLYILRLVQKASPWRIFLGLLATALSVGSEFLINVYLIRLVLNGMQNGIAFQEVFKQVLVIGAILVAYYVFHNLYSELYLPVSDRVIYQNIHNQIFMKARKVDVSCYEDPAFYSKYTKTIDAASRITDEVLTSINSWRKRYLRF